MTWIQTSDAPGTDYTRMAVDVPHDRISAFVFAVHEALKEAEPSTTDPQKNAATAAGHLLEMDPGLQQVVFEYDRHLAMRVSRDTITMSITPVFDRVQAPADVEFEGPDCGDAAEGGDEQ